MIDWGDVDGRPERSVTARTAMRWGCAALFVVAAHGAGAWAALKWQPIEAMPSQPPPAVMIERAPLAVAPPTPQQEVAPGPEMTESQPEPTPEAPTPVEDAPRDPTPPDPQQMAQADKPEQPSASPEVTPPDLPKKDKAEAVLSPPPKQQEDKKPPPKASEAERKKPVDPNKPRQRQTTAPTAQARMADSAAAPSSGASFSSSVSPATWRGELMAHLNRYKRLPPGAAGSGTASVAFTISRTGQVLSARLIGSSGDPVLDQEATALPRRASPVPAPPPNVGGASVTLTVPIHFGS
ncbi:TonB family protein [Bradyrhizobium sp. 930_D9_N1_4]|uniref:energy transducer TonB family protein n=1 Tax=Bradyrhizobium sp. 930_D9_N1_4 TaxID=3240374 RepID=UPI003F8C1D87